MNNRNSEPPTTWRDWLLTLAMGALMVGCVAGVLVLSLLASGSR